MTHNYLFNLISRILYLNYESFYEIIKNIFSGSLFDPNMMENLPEDYNKDFNPYVVKINDYIKKCEDYRTALYQQIFISVNLNYIFSRLETKYNFGRFFSYLSQIVSSLTGAEMIDYIYSIVSGLFYPEFYCIRIVEKYQFIFL